MGSFHCHDIMKINKKLLMAALAGAIVVGGGVNTYAADEPIDLEELEKNRDKENVGDLEKVEDKAPKAPSQEYTPTKEETLKAEKENAIKELKEAGVTSELFLNQIRNAKTIDSVNALKAELLKSHKDSKTDETLADWAKKTRISKS